MTVKLAGEISRDVSLEDSVRVLVLLVITSCTPGESSFSTKWRLRMAADDSSNSVATDGSMEVGDLRGDSWGGVGQEGVLESEGLVTVLASPAGGVGDTGGEGARIFFRLALGENASIIRSFIDGDLSGDPPCECCGDCRGDTAPESPPCAPLNVLI